MSDERDDAPSIPGLPYLNLLVPAATCQVFSDSTIVGILDDSSNTPLFFALLLLFALLIVLPILHFFGVLSFVLQVLFHLLDALFCRQARRCRRSRLIPLCFCSRCLRCFLTSCCFSFFLLNLSVHLFAFPFFHAAHIIRVINCAARLGGRPHYAIYDMFVLTQHLNYGVIILKLLTPGLRAFLPDLVAVPDDDTLVFAGRSKKFPTVVHSDATYPVRVSMS